MMKIFENFNSLNITYRVYDIDSKDDTPMCDTMIILELLEYLRSLKSHNGEDWAEYLLLALEDGFGNPILWVDVRNFNCFF